MVTSNTTRDRLTGSVAAGPLRLIKNHFWDPFFRDFLVNNLAKRGVTPNQVTIAATTLTLGSAPLAATGHFTWAGIVYCLGSLGDIVDGALARKLGTASKAGAFLDSTLDRVVEAIVLLGIGLGIGTQAGYLVTFLLLASSLLYSYTKARAGSLGVELEVRWMQRADRILWVAVTLAVAPIFALWLDYPAHELIIGSFSICVGFAVVGFVLRFREAYQRLS